MLHMKLDKRVFFVFATIMLILTACSSQQTQQPTSPPNAPPSAQAATQPAVQPTQPPAAASGTITLYTSVPQPIMDKIQNDFQARFPEIKLEVFRAGTSQVVAKIQTEKEAGAVQADLVWVAEPSTYEDFKAQDLLLKFTPEGADMLSEDLKDSEGYYYAGRLINMVIGYNTSIEQKPVSWQDLSSDKFAGTKLGFPTPLNSGAAEAAVRALVDQYGWEYFDNFKKNGGVQVQNNSAARDQLATGELQVSALLDYIIREAKKQGSPVDYVWPEDGAVFIPSPIAIFKDSKNPQAAQVFVEYVLSKEGQQSLVDLGDFYPVRDDVNPPAGAPPLKDIKRLKVDWKAVRDKRQETKDQWNSIFGQ